MDETGRIYKCDIEVGEHAHHFFTKIYESNSSMIQPSLSSDFQPSVTDTMNMSLTEDITYLEIKKAVDSIGSDRAPGPDGLTARFYKECWDIIGSDVTRGVKFFSKLLT